MPPWLRRIDKIPDAELTLFEYQTIFPSRVIAKTRTDSGGKFAFPTVNAGHYTLKIKAGDHEDYFDIEVTDRVPTTAKVLINISPVEPDCTGGHELDVYPEQK
ncbi:MAG TPA: carboxypeptidase-like regulatory domain-containing protein [Candidatus Limnocylindrales bacterium]|nr:carboxypeptidase-like regulatory domain-containing protein [Candidatus Limnocylindrales bacterium]